jgi:hypothetical protein
VNRARCTQLRDHLVELRLRNTGMDVDVDAHRQAMKHALGDRFVASCEQGMSSSELKCALAAKELRAATSCSGAVQ